MRLLRSFLTQSGLTAISRVFGVARDMILAARIGAGPVGDAWFTALQLPNLFRRTLAEGAFSQAFVPIYTRILGEDGKDAAMDAAGQSLSALLFLTLSLSLIAQLAMPWIMLILQAGYRDVPEIFDLSILLARITMPYLTGMACAALFAGMLNAASKFAVAALAPTLFNLCLIIGLLAFDSPVACALSASVAVLVSGVLQAGILWLAADRAGLRLRLVWPRLTPQVRRIAALAGPGSLAAAAAQINIVVSQSLASLEPGAKSWMTYADRLYQLPLGLVGVALGITLLPRLSDPNADDGQKTRTLDFAILLGMGLTIPAAAALMSVSFTLVNGLFGRGAFSLQDAAMTSTALFHFAWGAPAFVLIKILAPAFFARQDTLLPMRHALAGILCNILLGVGMFLWLRAEGAAGFPGLAAATSVAAWLNAGLLAMSLHRKNIYRTQSQLWNRLIRILAATAIMSTVLLALPDETNIASKELNMLLITAIGIAVYAAAALLTGAIRWQEIRQAMARR